MTPLNGEGGFAAIEIAIVGAILFLLMSTSPSLSPTMGVGFLVLGLVPLVVSWLRRRRISTFITSVLGVIAFFFGIRLLYLGVLTHPRNFAELIRKSDQLACQSNLGTIRRALFAYHKTKKEFPVDIATLASHRTFLSEIPPAKTPNYHPDSSVVRFGVVSNDSGGWLYDNVKGNKKFGEIWVNCTHTDTRGTRWDTY
jgi:hypothetical protein